jgi:hypothetical protein
MSKSNANVKNKYEKKEKNFPVNFGEVLFSEAYCTMTILRVAVKPSVSSV